MATKKYFLMFIFLFFLFAILSYNQQSNYVGSSTCVECHDDVGKFFEGSIHYKPFFLGKVGDGCETCHKEGSKHTEDPSSENIFGKRGLEKLTPKEKDELCLKCHRENITKKDKFVYSIHKKNMVSCFDCHSEVLHFKSNEKEKIVSDLNKPFSMNTSVKMCISCHSERLSDTYLPYRHPLDKGTMSCLDCHNIHDKDKCVSGIGEDVNSVCFKCHREQKGPFAFRHLALEEGCSTCHNPHGSVNDKMLRQNTNGLCLNCHYEIEFPKVGAVNHKSRLKERARCFDCHISVHGSNLSDHFIR